uniref:Uncharacterized protein n=1 Tax=Strigamia maritima TaxID=126957 RepID=T1JDJ0_STRMM
MLCRIPRQQKTTFNILGESYSTVWNGLCHLSGHEVEKNETMAANLLSQAASYGNTYAMLVLANMYIKGLGVEKDPDKYIELLVKVTEQPLVENGRRNKDVATAEHNLGVSYSKGIGVRKDLERAIEWYNLAADHGFAMAAYILGCHYMRGSGVERNEEKAVECWKEAARGKLANAMRSLSHYFYNDLEPDQALKWHKRALLCEQDDKTYEVFEDNLTILKQLCRFNQIMKWEETIRLSIDGLSVRERKYRFIRDKIPISNFFDKNESLLTEKDIPVAVKKVFDGYNYAFESVFRLNEFDTGLGWRLQQAVIRFGRALLSLKAINKAGEKFKFIYELARCLKTELIVAQWDPPDRKLAAEVVRELWIDMRNYTWLNELDKEARICYVYFYRNQVVLRDCVAKYPEEVYFRRLLVTSLSDHEEGLREVEKALEVFHNDCELLFGKAKHLSGLGKNFLVVKALEDFISFAPPKHWLIPEAYYAMALRYVRLNPEINCESVQNAKLKVMDYFCSGMSAETIKLPWLIKYRNGRLEKLFELTIEMKLGRKKAVDCRSKLVEPSRVELIKLHRKRVRENVAEDEADKEDAVVCFEKEKILFCCLL